MFAEEQGSFLVGAAAALKTTACKIGFVGGVETPLIQKFEAGYEAGAKAVAPSIQIDAKYLTPAGDFTGFNDPAKATEVARGQLDGGADIVYHASGASGKGVFEAVSAANTAQAPKWAIGVDSDQAKTATRPTNERILTSMLKRVDVAVYDYINASAAGDLTTLPKVFDLKVDGVGLRHHGRPPGGHRAAAGRVQGGDHQRPDHGAQHRRRAAGSDEGAGGGMAESTASARRRGARTGPASTPSSCVGITKRFPGVVANDDIHLRVRRGEVHALCGENGAGKSTLMKILYGMQQPDEGVIRVDGAEVAFRSPADAIRAGIGMVHQHFMLADNLTVRRTCVLGAEGVARHRRRGPAPDRRAGPARGPARRAGHAAGAPRRGGPAAGGDPQGALPRRPHGDPGRAHGRPGAAGGRRAVRHPARAAGARATRSCSSPTSWTRCARSPTASR